MNRLFLLVFLFSLSSCWLKEKYNIGELPITPTNLTDFNSEYDDYNSAAPSLGETFPLCFSSNRHSYGGEFNFVYKLMSVRFSRSTGLLNVYNETDGRLDVFHRYENLRSALSRTNTRANEFGPYLISTGSQQQVIAGIEEWYESYYLLYANDENGDLDIKYIQNIDDISFSVPKEVRFLNSSYDDAYPTFNSDNSEIYFTSNREGNFDIYYTDVNSSYELEVVLSDTTIHTILKYDQLSSDADDKCPFIAENLMVFASNREGGYGGYDLYYSKLENGMWTAPTNFGEEINTEYDEFRPIVRPLENYSNDFMLFSSNRPGGLGGFDLYYVGIDKQ